MYGQQRLLPVFIHKQWGFPKQSLACVKAFKFLKQKSGSASAAT
jgi:hypothetical protein